MSILIPGMEMPKSCCACPLFKSNMSKQLFCKAFGAFDKSDYDKLPIERMKNCPIVPVPPHGRLIDADALLESEPGYTIPNYNSDGYVADLEGAYTEIQIEDAPTIIPASGGKENE